MIVFSRVTGCVAAFCLATFFVARLWGQSPAEPAEPPLTPLQRAQKIEELLKGFPEPAVNSFPTMRRPEAHPELQPAHDAAPKRQVRFILEGPADMPAPEGTITFRYRFTDGTASFPVGANGRSAVGYPGSVSLVKGANAIDLPTPIILESLRSDVPGFAVEFPESLSVARGGEPLEFRIVAKAAGLIHGQVLARDGTAVEVAAIHVFDLNATRAQQRLSASLGRPTSVRRLPGRYAAFPMGLNSTYQLAVVSAEGLFLSDPLPLTDRTPIRAVDFPFATLTKPATGRLLQFDGRPYVGRAPLVWRCQWGAIPAGMLATDPDGKFSVHFSPTLPGSLGMSFEGLDGADIPRQFLPLRPGDNGDVVLKKGVSMQGTVVDKATNAPMANVTLWIVQAPASPDGTTTQVITDAEGRFRVLNLGAGDYLIQSPTAYDGEIEVVPAPDGRSHTIKTLEGYKPRTYAAGTGEHLTIKITPRPATPFVRTPRVP